MITRRATWHPERGTPVNGKVVAQRPGPLTGEMVTTFEADSGSCFTIFSTMGYRPSHDLTGVEYGTLY